jgi:hypothetical protein
MQPLDPNTAVKIRGCFIGIPGRRNKVHVETERGDMHLTQVSTDLDKITNHWWRSSSLPEIGNSEFGFWGNVKVRLFLLIHVDKSF